MQRFLRELAGACSVSYSNEVQAKAIITLCNYDKYQSPFSRGEYSNEYSNKYADKYK